MQILTVQQPWAWLIVNGWKDVENRSWRTDYRGPLLIHCSRKFDGKATQRAFETIVRLGLMTAAELPAAPDLVKGCGNIIGQVELVGCMRACSSPWATDDWSWMLRSPQRLMIPLPWSGRLGLTKCPARIRDQLLLLPRRE